MAVFNDLLVKGPAKFLGGIDGNLTATSAEKLTTSAGSATRPIYFSDGKPVATTYTLGKSVPSDAVFTDTVTTVTTSGSGNAVTAITASNGKLTVTKGSTFLTAHPTITKSTDTTSTASPAHGGTFTVVDSVTRDGNGHVTKINTKTVTLPTDNNTDTKVTQTVTTANATFPLLLAPNGQTATTTTSAYFDSGVTLNPSTNTIAANVSGNAATATKLATARTISLTGSVTGSGSFDGSGNLSIATTTNHSHSYLPLSGGTLTGILKIVPTGSATEGGELQLGAPSGNNKVNGLVIDSFSGLLRIFGQASADGSSKTGSGTPLTFDPYDRVMKSSGSAWYLYGIHAYTRTGSDSFEQTNRWMSSDAGQISADYYRNNSDSSRYDRYMRVFVPGSSEKYYSDLRVGVTSSLADWNIVGTGITAQLRVNSHLVYHAGYKPHATGSFTAPSSGSSITITLGFQPSCVFVWMGIAGNRQVWAAQTITSTGFTFTNTGLVDGGSLIPGSQPAYYIAFR